MIPRAIPADFDTDGFPCASPGQFSAPASGPRRRQSRRYPRIHDARDVRRNLSRHRRTQGVRAKRPTCCRWKRSCSRWSPKDRAISPACASTATSGKRTARPRLSTRSESGQTGRRRPRLGGGRYPTTELTVRCWNGRPWRPLNHVLADAAWARDRLRPFAGQHAVVEAGLVRFVFAVDGAGWLVPSESPGSRR